MSRASLRQLQLNTSWGPLNLVGGSRAGDGTLILLPQLHLALDAGRAHRALPPMTTVAVSHGHMDHLGGIGYWASQRHLQAMGPARLLVPREIAVEVEEILTIHARLEGGEPYDVTVVPVSAGDLHRFRNDMDLSFFTTDHWVPTLGSRLVWRRRRLLPAFADLPGEEIASRRAAGQTVTEEVECHLLSYCADSGPGILDGDHGVLGAEIVLVECSFYRSRDRERAARFGHMHLEDLLPRVDRFGCRHLVLIHASRRHRLRDVEKILDDRLRPVLDCELHHLMVDWN